MKVDLLMVTTDQPFATVEGDSSNDTMVPLTNDDMETAMDNRMNRNWSKMKTVPASLKFPTESTMGDLPAKVYYIQDLDSRLRVNSVHLGSLSIPYPSDF